MPAEYLYRADAAVGRADREGVPELVLYQATRRFVDNEDATPGKGVDMVYYSLGIGHHTGLIDCFEERLRCPVSLVAEVIAALPDGCALAAHLRQARDRGECYLDKDDLPEMVAAVDAALGPGDPFRNLPTDELPAGRPVIVEDAGAWLGQFRLMLDVMMANWDASIVARRRGA